MVGLSEGKKKEEKFVTNSTFEMYEQGDTNEPVSQSILESYGQLGISNDREERKRKAFHEKQINSDKEI